MRLLALTRYGPLGASSRLRHLQYLPYLKASGIRTDVAPFFGDEYVQGLYSRQIPIASVFCSYVRRAARLLRAGPYDVVWLEKEVFPWLPFAMDAGLLSKRTRLFVDFDDARFHIYDCHPSRVVRQFLARKIDHVMAHADLVTVGNEYLARRAKQAGCQRVEWLPTVIDLDRYSCRLPGEAGAKLVTIGWIGTPGTAHFLQIVAPVLEELRRRLPIRCVAIGARPDQVQGTPFEAWPWSERDEVTLLQMLDIGIMPLPDSPFERGKCGYKLIQYMACGVPVVASPIGVNVDLVSPDVGFLASGRADWVAAFEALIQDRSLRERFGAMGRRRVQETFCLQVQAPRLIAMLQSLASGTC